MSDHDAESESEIEVDPQAPSTSSTLTAVESIELVKNILDAKLTSMETRLENKFIFLNNEYQERKETKEKREPYEFKSKSNKIQHAFNSEILDDIGDVKKSYQSTNKKRTCDQLDAIETKLKKRNKLIKIADSTEGGWTTVELYEQGRLGSDSEDEKRIRAAERKAVAKKKVPSSKRPIYRDAQRNKTPFKRAKPTDVCLNCYQTGHWKRDCRVTNKGKEKQRYVNDKSKIETPNVKGSLKKQLTFWAEELKANKTILKVIEQGYRLDFEELPAGKEFGNNFSALKHPDFVQSEILNLLNTGRVRETTAKPFIVNPLTVSVNPDESLRLILDLRYVNGFLRQEYVRYDDWRVFIDYLEKDSWCFKFDLKSGYHHIDIHEDFFQYLGFAWDFGGVVRYFVFTVLVFGLSPAARIFTKVLKPVATYLRNWGLNLAVYLDDGAGTERSQSEARDSANRVFDTLIKSGFVINDKKSIKEPVQCFTWLGITVDTEKGLLYISEKRINKCFTHLNSVLYARRVSARTVAKLVGCIVSMYLVLGPVVNLRTRYLSSIICNMSAWDTLINITSCTFATEELVFWLTNLKRLNCKNIFTVDEVFDYYVHSDASDNALGIVVDDYKCHRNLSLCEQSKSSTYRELIAVLFGLQNFKELFSYKKILWHVDNYAASIIMNKGSSKHDLHTLAIKMHDLMMKYEIELIVKWIPREYNTTADLLSKYIDIDNWEISDYVFQWMEFEWGPFTIDRFANGYNKKVKHYNSKFFEIGSQGVDAFNMDWGKDNNLFVPPISLVNRVISKCIKDRAQGALVIPLWPTSSYWSMLRHRGAWASFVLDTKKFTFQEALEATGMSQLSWPSLGSIKSDLLAVRLYCR